MNNADNEFIDKVVNNIKPGVAYQEAYGVDGLGSGSKAKALMENPEIKECIVARLKVAGITEHKIHKTLRKQLDAKKIMYVDPKLARVEVDDNDAQLKATTIGYKLLGLMKDKDVYIDNRQVTFSGDVEQLGQVVAEMKALRQRVAIDTTGEVI